MNLNAPLSATAVGSFPHKNPQDACDLILENLTEIPVWPQLPAIALQEQMEIQYSEGLPRVVIDETKERMFFDTSGDPTPDLEKFYENFLMENLDFFAISPQFSRGIPAMLSRLQEMDLSGIKYFKMQVTGPVSIGLSITDENKRAVYYNDMFRDVIVKGVAMKARWQLQAFDSLGLPLICFIDEPILSAFGSSTYVSVKREDVVAYLSEVVQAIKATGALAGIHCCGNTEWTIPIDAGVDIINFDAYDYGETIGLYSQQMKTFLYNGGVLAWGVVPTSEKIETETTESLAQKFNSLVDDLTAKGIDRDIVLNNALITASCGTGTIPLKRSVRVIQETRRVSDLLKQEFLNG